MLLHYLLWTKYTFWNAFSSWFLLRCLQLCMIEKILLIWIRLKHYCPPLLVWFLDDQMACIQWNLKLWVGFDLLQLAKCKAYTEVIWHIFLHWCQHEVLVFGEMFLYRWRQLPKSLEALFKFLWKHLFPFPISNLISWQVWASIHYHRLWWSCWSPYKLY